MGQAAQRGFNPAYYHRDVRPELLEDFGIDRDGIVRTGSGATFRGVGIVAAQAFGSCVMVYHRVHCPGIHCKIEPRCPELAEIPQIVPPIGLRHHCHPIAEFLQPSGNHGSTEGRMVYESIPGEEDDVDIVPSQSLHLLDRGRYHICLHCHKIFAKLSFFCNLRIIYSLTLPERFYIFAEMRDFEPAEQELWLTKNESWCFPARE